MLFSSGASDMIVTLMACNRLFSIWSISIYDKRNNQLVSFKRRSTKKKSVPFKVLLQVVSAFILSFSFHIPFFIDTSDDPMQCGYCNFHQHSPKGNLSVYKLTINLCKNNLSYFKNILQDYVSIYMIWKYPGNVTPSTFGSSLVLDDYQCDKGCRIYLSSYLSCMKYIPTILIVCLNIAIAWRMRRIAKVRRQLHHSTIVPEFSSLTTFDAKISNSSR